MKINLPIMKKVPDNATESDRKLLHAEYINNLVYLNPRLFNKDGTRKTLLQILFFK